MAARAGATGGARAASAFKEETFVLRATPSIKRYNIARFDVPDVPKFASCAQPVMMYREPEKVEEEEEKKEEEVGYNPALRKRRRRRRNTRTANWVIEDNEGKNKFVGAFEGGQSSMYCLFVKNRHNDEFSVIPVEQWFRFKKPLNYRTLTLEEAEELNNEKKRAVERWLMKHKMFADDKNDNGDVVGGPRLRTGAVGGGGGGGAKKTGDGGDDIFEVKESKPKRAAPRPKKVETEATGEDGGDFDEKFDDDESEAEIENDDTKVIESDSEEDEIVEGDASGKLNETGQAMKDLLKRAQSGEMDAANEKEEAEEGSDDEYSAQDMEKVRRDLGGNIIRDRSAASGAATDEAAGGASDAEKPAEAGTAGAAKPAGTSAESATNGKRPAENPVPDPTPTKTSKPTPGPATRLTEAGVQQELMRYGGRMKSRDLLKKLKKLLVTDDDKAMLKDILRTICEVEKDAIEGNLFVLKSQFR